MKGSFAQVEEKEIVIGEEKRIFIRNLYGNTKLKTWNSQRLKLTITKHLTGDFSEQEAEKRLKHIELKEKKSEKGLSLEVSVPLFILTPDVKIGVDLDVFAPPYINLEIDTGLQKLNGSRKEGYINLSYKDKLLTKIQNVKGSLSILSGPADIEIKNSEGKISVESSSGRITIKGFSGEMNVKNESGDIFLEECLGAIYVRNKSGNITLKGIEALLLSVKTSSGNIKADINPIKEGAYDLESYSGYIKLKLPFHSSCHVRLETKCGKILSEPPFTLEGNEMRLGSGESSLALKTSSGNIYVLHKLEEEKEDGHTYR